MPLISVVIPTFNRAELLVRAVYSVYRQSFRDLEIIVVDDGSEDHTERKLAWLTSVCPGLADMLVYERFSQRRGANAARNVGIHKARGRYVAFLDSDDVWHPEKLAQQLKRIEQESRRNQGYRPYFCFTGRFRVDGNYQVVARQFQGSIREVETRIRRMNSIGTLSSVLVTTWLARHLNGFDESLFACQDWDFYVRAVPYCHVVSVREPFVMYYDGEIERISHASRTRLASHLILYKRYLRGRVQPHELAELYRNVSEDLEHLGKPLLARRFYRTHKWLRGEFVDAVALAFNDRSREIRADRYARYAQKEAERADAGSRDDETYLEGYRRILQAPLWADERSAVVTPRRDEAPRWQLGSPQL